LLGVYLVFILAIAVSSILVRRRHFWSQSDSLMLIFGIVDAAREIAVDTILTGCALLAYRRWQGDRSYPSRAGHWLLLRALAVFATLRIYQLLLPALAVSATRTIAVLSGAGAYVSVLIIDLAFLWCLRRHLPRHWVAVFFVRCIATAIRAAFLFMERERDATNEVDFNFLSVGAALFVALVICWAIGRDRRSGVPTDGLHRLGIATELALHALNAIVPIYLFLRLLARRPY
jgi:hypothetical protein